MKQPLMKYPYRSVDWAFMKHMDIVDAERPTHVYLRRFIFFKTPLFASYKHKIYTPDKDRDPHNHPMSFLSIVLRGGYTEQRWFDWVEEKRVRRRGSFAVTRKNTFHQIEELHRTPTTTLLFCGPRSPEGWGFLTAEGYIDQETYIAQKGLPR